PLRLIRPDALPSDFHFPEFQEALESGGIPHVEIATAETLRRVLGLGQVAHENLTPEISGWRQRLDEWLHLWLWKTYSKFRKVVGGSVSGIAKPLPIPQDLERQ